MRRARPSRRFAGCCPGSESPTIIPLEGSERPGRDPRGVPRKRVLGNTRESEEGRRELAAGASRREDAGLDAHEVIEWKTASPEARRAALARPAAGSREEVVRQAGGDHFRGARRRRRGGASLHAAVRWPGARRSARRARPSFAQPAPRCAPIRSRRWSAPSPMSRVFTRRSFRSRCRRDDAGRACANASRVRSTASACTCRPVPLRCPPPPSCWPCRRASPAARRARLQLAGSWTASVHAAVLVAAQLCGIDTVYKMGGAQAIAALAFGTETVQKVDKIFGPGSAWVTAAKQLVAADPAGAAIDLPAGPSEVLVIADDSANAAFRRGGPAGAGRTRRDRAGHAGHHVGRRWRARWAPRSSADAPRCRARDIVEQSHGEQPLHRGGRPRHGHRGLE